MNPDRVAGPRHPMGVLAVRYYKVDLRRLPFAVVWRWGNTRSFVQFAIQRFFGAPMYGPLLVPDDHTVRLLPDSEAEPWLVGPLKPIDAELRELGFLHITAYSVPTVGPTLGLGRAYLAAERDAFAFAVVSRQARGYERGIVLYSCCDGRWLGTTSNRHGLVPLPEIDGLRLPGASVTDVVTRHYMRLSTRRDLFTPDAVVQALEHHRARQLEYYTSLGLYVPATEKDLAVALERQAALRSSLGG